jgi:hypothetical protein
LEELVSLDHEMRGEFPDLFPLELPPVVETTSTMHHLKLINPALVHNQWEYAPARRYLEFWHRLLNQHVAAGRLRLSSSPFGSPAYIVPKKDPTELPRWVNDYRKLNANTIKDHTPLPLPDEGLQSCTGAKIWGKIDMTNSFFQTHMKEEDIKKTTVKIPWGLFEWVIMPMGLCNAPATHQRRINKALRDLIGQSCYAYLDDIVIWSDSDEQHRQRCRQVLACLRKAGLYCSVKKTDLATERVEFLGHVISAAGIEADPAKIAKIVEWSLPEDNQAAARLPWTRTVPPEVHSGTCGAHSSPHTADKEELSAGPHWLLDEAGTAGVRGDQADRCQACDAPSD